MIHSSNQDHASFMSHYITNPNNAILEIYHRFALSLVDPQQNEKLNDLGVISQTNRYFKFNPRLVRKFGMIKHQPGGTQPASGCSLASQFLFKKLPIGSMMVYLLYLHLPPPKKKRNAGKYTVRPYRMVWDSQPDQLICKKKNRSAPRSQSLQIRPKSESEFQKQGRVSIRPSQGGPQPIVTSGIFQPICFGFFTSKTI